ncbi:Metallo-dependent phosphatase-like protein [Xylariaceae sp. FL1651]|nr:Metallo-dependent phosphatase-like protein [Xylariaceae sp. FL1651]
MPAHANMLLTSSNPSTHTTSYDKAHTVITDLTVGFCSLPSPPSASTCTLDLQKWHRIEKELYLHTTQQSAWLYVAQMNEEELTADDLVVTGIKVGNVCPGAGVDNSWESRPAGIWVRRSSFTSDRNRSVTDVDVLFGVDAIDPRPQWTLMQTPLKLHAQPGGRGRPRPNDPPGALRVKEDGKFKIVQISDTHMVTGVGVCKDAMDAHGRPLPESEADPLTVNFLGAILDVEKPDLVVLTGDQLHHDILDSQSALFKVIAPLIERSIPYAAVFGNHDAEGTYALSHYMSGMAQMSLLQNLPFSLCQPGPEHVDGVGNYFLQILAPEPSELPLSTLYFLDSHGQIPSKVKDPDYDWIQQTQIDWFTNTSRALRKAREKNDSLNRYHLSLVFMHIPLPEYADSDLTIRGGHRGELTEGPSFNSHFYDALADEKIAAVGCGHDHVNDFCGLRPEKKQDDDDEHKQQPLNDKAPQMGPWLCYGGGSGFGGYGSYGGKRYHRRTRVWELDTTTGTIETWKHVEYACERVDKLVLLEGGVVVVGPSNIDVD